MRRMRNIYRKLSERFESESEPESETKVQVRKRAEVSVKTDEDTPVMLYVDKVITVAMLTLFVVVGLSVTVMMMGL